jgi:F-type H+-transporting ATPase subunit b
MTTPLAANNFLVPNATFIVELLVFVVILVMLGRGVGPSRLGLPYLNRMLTDRQESIRRTFAEAEEAKAAAKAAEDEYRSQLVEARHEAARIREEARQEGAAIIAELREQAQVEADRILKHAHLQVEAERQQVVQQLRRQVGTMATTLAGRIVGESLEDDARRERTVERFIATLESQDPAPAGGNG